MVLTDPAVSSRLGLLPLLRRATGVAHPAADLVSFAVASVSEEGVSTVTEIMPPRLLLLLPTGAKYHADGLPSGCVSAAWQQMHVPQTLEPLRKVTTMTRSASLMHIYCI